MDIKWVLHQWFTSFLITNLQVVLYTSWLETSATRATQSESAIENKTTSNQELAGELQKLILENLKIGKHTHLFKTRFWVLILHIWN